tara:strand:- start:843 stop:1214 length:372 start_codon:yes stop_codon:yes gene_type:complete
MNAKQRKLEWDSLAEPKPSWESFKRLVGQFDSTKTALIHWEKKQRSKLQDAVQAIIEARDLCGNEREALQDWQHENGRLTTHEKRQVWDAVEREWSVCQTEAGVIFPISKHERRKIFRSLESA